MAKHAKEQVKGALGRKVAAVALVVCLIGLVACGVAFAMQQSQLSKAEKVAAETPVPEVPSQQEKPQELAANPIDFASLQAANPDIYAWIYIPDTQVNYPILQHSSDDSFYLDHDQDGQPNAAGAIYTEGEYNGKDFKDPVTVAYGHNVKGDLMFASLHDFEDAEFFDSHPAFYVYMPGHILTYQVLAAQGTGDNHILYGKNYTDETQFTAYLDEVRNPVSSESNVRDGVALDSGSRILQLSTCNYTYGNDRYVLTGVLADDQPTL